MTKKEYILAVIDALPKREMWRGIKAMVQNDQLEDETIDKLVIIFKKVMQEITDSLRENKVKENQNKPNFQPHTIVEFRKFLFQYVKWIPWSKEWKQQVLSCKDYQQLKNQILDLFGKIN